jgi:thiol:disulfide interchange protein DsbD
MMLACKIRSKSWPMAATLIILGCMTFMIGFSLERVQGEVLDVKTYVSQDGVHPGGMIDIAFLLDIIPGWHVNGPELADPYLISCALIVEEDESVEVREIYYPVPETRTYSFSETELQVYEGKVLLGARIKVSDTAAQGEVKVKANFLYQACDDMSCMAPETLEFEVPIQVVPTDTAIDQINPDIFAKIKFR